MSTEAKIQIQIDPKYVLRLAGTLLAIAAIVALLLGFVNSITADKIDAIQAQKTQTALQSVFEGATFTKQDITADQTAIAAGDDTKSKLIAIYAVDDGSGYAIEVGPSGFGGTIDMIVGVSSDGSIAGISVVSNSETSGIGTEVCKDKPNRNGDGVLSQFKGKTSGTDNLFTVNSGSNEVDAISGATVSTKAITRGVNAAMLVYETLG
ncbi:MAG: RnfABCDGE type electron transport complex subunit G [Oscillospiraceae bacterium]|nr:RnfABCDGE type electron transport complex subunit G [Oscillospiraceae bacterium]